MTSLQDSFNEPSCSDIPPPLTDSFTESVLIPSKLHTHSDSKVQFCPDSIRSIMKDIFDKIPTDITFDQKMDKRIVVVRRLCGDNETPKHLRLCSSSGILTRIQGLQDPSEEAFARAKDSQAMINRIVEVYLRFNGMVSPMKPEEYAELMEAYDV